MDRRQFIFTASAATCAIPAGLAARPVITPTAQQMLGLTRAVQANFGPGFAILSATFGENQTRAVIGAHGAFYEIEDGGRSGWRILSSTEL
ncbi:hypothetical protein ACN2XU_14660 [Primorskyibacter sp. 2E107]|uniref:hypothetical protein n=1 Tax=Primorskyibacter sp. 2E107 TaxID=3403458 RepID=UPI003AF8380A